MNNTTSIRILQVACGNVILVSSLCLWKESWKKPNFQHRDQCRKFENLRMELMNLKQVFHCSSRRENVHHESKFYFKGNTYYRTQHVKTTGKMIVMNQIYGNQTYFNNKLCSKSFSIQHTSWWVDMNVAPRAPWSDPLLLMFEDICVYR